MKFRELKSVNKRREYIEKLLNIKLDKLSVYPPGLDIAQLKNCENMIGATSIPLGVAGPLKIKGDFASGIYYLPLATTEGALVASVNRGCKAISESGGAIVVCHDVGITRGSVFQTGGIKQSIYLKSWIESNQSVLKDVSESTSTHLKFLNSKIKIIGNYLFVRFSFDTGEAMGMNMATFAADQMVSLITQKTGINCLSLAGNFDNDKKPSYLNFIEGRGRTVFAEVTLPDAVIKSVLKTSAADIHRLVKAKCFMGSIISGSNAYNAHFANMLTALFIALGQDVAHVAEGSVGITSTEIVDGGLYVTVFLPDLPLGTIGGGTGLPSQADAFKIMNLVNGKSGDKARMLAEIIGAAVLAGEISLLSALSIGQLAAAHKKLGRGLKL